MSFIAGQYIATYGASPGAVGQLKNGVSLQHSLFKQLITGDNMAKAPQDAVNQGAEMFAEYTMIEYNAAKAGIILWPLSATIFDIGIIGRLDSAIWAQLILTAVANTPAATSPATVTMSAVILAEGYPVSLLFAPELREVPIRQRVYPNTANGGGTGKIFGSTT